MSTDHELKSIRAIMRTLEALPPEARSRVLGYVVDRYAETDYVPAPSDTMPSIPEPER